MDSLPAERTFRNSSRTAESQACLLLCEKPARTVKAKRGKERDARRKEEKDCVKVTVAEDSVTAYIGNSGTNAMMDPDELAELLKRSEFHRMIR